MPADLPDLAPFQRARLSRFGVERSVDMHCHILSAIDDGPVDLDESLQLARALVRDGITDVIATPHQLGRYDHGNWAAEIRESVLRLQETLDKRRIPLRLHAGAEIRLDERIAKLLAADQLLTLADRRRCLLLELPSALLIEAASVLAHFKSLDATIVLAHAERYELLQRDPDRAAEWIDGGALLQVNAGAVVGSFGAVPREAAMRFLEERWVSLIATDAHSVGNRRPQLSEAIDAIAASFGEAMAKRLCIENPGRILNGEEIEPEQSSKVPA